MAVSLADTPTSPPKTANGVGFAVPETRGALYDDDKDSSTTNDSPPALSSAILPVPRERSLPSMRLNIEIPPTSIAPVPATVATTSVPIDVKERRNSVNFKDMNESGSFGTYTNPPIEDAEDLDEDEEEEGMDGLFSRFIMAATKLLFGSRTGFVMYFVLASSLIVLSVMDKVHGELPPVLTFLLFALISLGIMEALQLIRLTWKFVAIKVLFPESRILLFVSELIDPEAWNLIFSTASLMVWQLSQQTSKFIEGRTSFIFVPNAWAHGEDVKYSHVQAVKYVLIFLLLWAIRDCFVCFVMFRLMLGFLMNFNSEIISFFHKYSLIRRLNAGWIKLVPTRPLETDPSAQRDSSFSMSPADPVMAEVARAKAIIISQNLDFAQMEKLREESKQRLLRTTVTRDLSKLTGSVCRHDAFSQSKLMSAHSNMRAEPGEGTAAEDHMEVSGSPSPSFLMQPRKRMDLTPAMRKRRVREFHVELTGRALPRVLERSHIQSLTKSRLLNMISVAWLESNPVVIFPDGARTELITKKLAREAGDALFQTLLAFRQSIGMFDETLDQALNMDRPSTGEPSGELNRVRPKKSDSSLPEVSLAPAKDAMITYDVQEAYPPSPGTVISLTGTHHSVFPRDGHSDSGSAHPKSGVHWFKRRRGSIAAHSGSQHHGGMLSLLPSPQPVASPLLMRQNAFQPGMRSGPSLGGSKPLTEAQLAAITAAEIRKVKMVVPDDKECLTQDFFELFMNSQDAKDLMDFLDPGKLGKVTSKMFVRGVVNVYRTRKQMTTSLEAQAEIEGVFRRVCRFFLGGILAAIYLIILGINPNTILVSGAALASAAGVILSFVYTDFIQSIILIVFLNPYRIGDRVRIDGEAQYVKRITTYFTEFESLHGRIQYLSHKDLSSKLLINESRCKNATTELEVLFGERTTPGQYNALRNVLTAFLKSRPLEYIGDSLFMHIVGVGPSQFVKVAFWVTHTEGWGNWMAVRTGESNLFFFLMRQAQILGMTYKLPIQRWEVYPPPAPLAPQMSPTPSLSPSSSSMTKISSRWPSSQDLQRLPPAAAFQSTTLHGAPNAFDSDLEGVFELEHYFQKESNLIADCPSRSSDGQTPILDELSPILDQPSRIPDWPPLSSEKQLRWRGANSAFCCK